MKIIIQSPTKAYLEDCTEHDIKSLKSQCSYTNISIQFAIKRHYKNQWFKNKNPILWEEDLDKLRKQLKGCILQKEGLRYFIYPGLIPYLNMIDCTIINKINYPEFKPIPWKVEPEFDPYPFQLKAVDNLFKIKHGNISLPTGAGKSLALLLCAKQAGLNSVVVTPSQSIFNELLSEFQKRLGKKYVGGYGDGKKDITKKITIAIGRSLTMLKPNTPQYDFFQNKQLLLCDESHVFASKELNQVCHGVLRKVPYRLFVSATQIRNDGTKILLDSIIGENVLKMSLKEAINQKYLCPLNFTILKTFSPSTRKRKDPIECKREHFLYNPNVIGLAAKIANASWNIKKESTLILVEELRQISMLIRLLNVPYTYIHSGSKKEAEKWNLNKVKLQNEIDRFNLGEVKVLIGTKAIATGTNIYPTHNTVNLMGGSSEIVTKQGAMGRSTRRLEISKYAQFHKTKPHSMIYDFKIINQPILDKQLNKRISFYGESGGNVVYL